MKPKVRLLTRELVDAVLADREDRHIVRSVLTTMVQTAINDFTRYYDSRYASNRVRDFDMLSARNKAVKRNVATRRTG